MKLSKTQKEFIKNVIDTEQQLNKTLWLKWVDNKWAMGTNEEVSTLFFVNARLVKSLTEKDIIIIKNLKINGDQL